MSNAPDDINLILQIASGQNSALSELYDRYSRLVFSLSVHIVGDSGTAEEITQDVFLQIWRKASDYDPNQGKVLTWVSRIARNRAIDMLRRRAVRPEGHTPGWDEDWLSMPDPDGNVEAAANSHVQQGMIRQALNELPPDQRDVLALAYFQGLSQQEIAAELQQPLGTIKTRIRLAMQKLRKSLGERTI